MRRSIRRLPHLSVLAVLVAGCSSGAGTEPSQTAGQDLFIANGTHIWNQNIPVCFYQSSLLTKDHSREKGIIQRAIERTWLRAANIPVTWNGTCPTSGGSFLRINLGPHTSTDGSTDGQTGTTGMANLAPASTPDPSIFNDPGIRIWIQDDGGSTEHRLEYVAVHEFGHVLGFDHEQDRSDNPDKNANCKGASVPGKGVGPYDPDSVMNYCADVSEGYLSEGDVMNVRSVYGFVPALGDFAADVSGDGKADTIAVKGDAIYVMLSDGTKFNWSGVWTPGGPFYGSRETLFADVDGNGTADAIAINNKGVFVMLSDGTKFTWAGQWTTGPFYGARRTIAADVNGDGKADLVAVNSEGLFVVLSTGKSFTWDGQWSGPLFGTRETLAGDVNGDGKADIVAVAGSGLQVAMSTGSRLNGGFVLQYRDGGAGGFSANAFAQVIADANGDGRADLVAMNAWGMDVSLSDGTGFGGVAWSTAPFYGSHASLLADVNGDHKVDAIAVNSKGDFVMTSSGSSHVWAGQWSDPFFSQ